MQRNNPSTSLEAYKKVSKEMLSGHHAGIISALEKLGNATYEEIANYLEWDDKNRASRRLAELEREEKVYKTGEKRKTKSNRNAFIYRIVPESKLSKPILIFEN